MGKSHNNNKPVTAQGADAAKEEEKSDKVQTSSEDKPQPDESKVADSIPDISLEVKPTAELSETNSSEVKADEQSGAEKPNEGTEEVKNTLEDHSEKPSSVVDPDFEQVPEKGEYKVKVVVSTKNLKAGDTHTVSGAIANQLLKKGIVKLI